MLPFLTQPLTSVSLCGISHRFPWLSRSPGQVTYVLLTRSPLASQLSVKKVSLLARLACIRHAASVHPEPGSNSSSGLYCFNQLLRELPPQVGRVLTSCPTGVSTRRTRGLQHVVPVSSAIVKVHRRNKKPLTSVSGRRSLLLFPFRARSAILAFPSASFCICDCAGVFPPTCEVSITRS